MVWPFIIISYFALFVFGISENIRGPLFPEILKHFAVNDSAGSLIFALSNISGLVASQSCRYILRRYDRLLVLRAGALGLFCSMWGLALSQHFEVFLVFCVGFGFSMGVIGLIPNVLVPLGSTPQRKQQMLSGLHTMYGLASLLAPVIAATAEIISGSWRTTFMLTSLAPFILTGYTFHKSHVNLHTKAPTPPKTAKVITRTLLPKLHLALMLSFAVALELMISTRLALYMQREQGASMELASYYVSGFFISMMAGRFLFTVVRFKTATSNLLMLSIIGSGAAIVAGLYLHPAFLALTGFAIAPFYPLAISWISSEFPEDLDAVVSYMMTLDALMLIFMQVSIGKLTDLYGIHNALFYGLAFVVGGVALGLSYPYIYKKNL